MRKILIAAFFFLLIGPLPGTAQRVPVDVVTDEVSAARIVLPPDRRPPGPGDHLRFVKGWHLTSRHSHFGGFSSLGLIGPRRFQLIGDNGYWTRLSLSDAGGATDGDAGVISDTQIRKLPRPAEYPNRKGFADAESSFYDPASGKTWVGLERVNQIFRFNADLTRVEARRRSPVLNQWPQNSGAEAMAHLPDGRTIILSEAADSDARGTEALIFAGDPAVADAPPERFFYDGQGKGRVTDAATLPDGRVLIVHRRLGVDPLFTTILAIADPAGLTRDNVWRSHVIGQMPSALRENYEGSAITKEGGKTFVWLVSDNNFNHWQRTLLMKFEIAGLPPRGAARHRKPENAP